jgi:signal transduction histidine kinase
MVLAPGLRIHSRNITDQLGRYLFHRIPDLDVVTDIQTTPARIRNSLRRALLNGTPADISRSYEITSGRTPWRFFVAMVVAGVLVKVSSLSRSAITIWLVSIMAMEAAFHALRSSAMRKSHSRLNVPILVIKHFMVYGSWTVMPLILEFRSPPEAIMGLIFLTGTLASASMTAVQIPAALVGLVPIAGAIVAPEVVDQLGHAPHDSALGVLVIKVLFLLNFISLIRNWYVTGRKEAMLRKELDESRRKAEDLATAKTLFLAHMSHEIRSPLSGVTLMANILRRLEDIPENQRQLIEQIDEGGQAILNLLNTVLDYSKIEAGKIGLSPVALDVRVLLQNIMSLYELRARQTNTLLSVSIDDGLPPTLMLDRNRLRQILTNLICNAIKFSPGATVHLHVGYEDRADGSLAVEVIDTGRGVDEAMREKLFKPYEQHQAAEAGTGLGLAICQGLVDAMHGKIGYRKTPNGGATFWVKIPATQPAAKYRA